MISNNKSSWKTKKTTPKQVETTNSQTTQASDSSVSVITKTTNPKIVIQSENFDGNDQRISYKHTLLKFICSIVMCTIILITFFISIKTFDMVKDLAHYIIK